MTSKSGLNSHDICSWFCRFPCGNWSRDYGQWQNWAKLVWIQSRFWGHI